MNQDTPSHLYKVVSPEIWLESQTTGLIMSPPMDDEFIHLSKEDQLEHVCKKFWNGMDHVVLKIATEKLHGQLVYETNPGGVTKYYHLYQGKIPLEAILEVFQFMYTATGLKIPSLRPVVV